MPTIYLDYNATTPVAPEVREAMLPFLGEQFGNPSSTHARGRHCRQAIDEARRRVAQLLGAEPGEIVFTGGGTESNNLALKGIALARLPAARGHLVISAIEHPAVTEPARFLERLGFEVSVVGCDSCGQVSVQQLADCLRPDTLLVSVMHANNEIGVVQHLPQIAEICRSRGVLLHSDAAQSVGKIATRVHDLGVDLLTVAGHKMYAPKGVGALWVRRGVTLEPLLHGAGHERGLRSGTENVPYLVGLGRAASLVIEHLAEAAPRMAGLRDRLEARLLRAVAGLSVNGSGAPRLPNTLSVNFPRVAGSELLARIPELCASTGAACHAGATHLSPTLAAIGLNPQIGRGAVRLSLGWQTTEEEVDWAASRLAAAWHESTGTEQ